MRKHSSTTKILYIANQTQTTNQTFDTKTERMNTTRRWRDEKKTLFFSIRFYFFGIVFFFFLLLSFVIVLQLSQIFRIFILCAFILSHEMSQTARIKNQRTDFLLFIVFLVFIFFFLLHFFHLVCDVMKSATISMLFFSLSSMSYCCSATATFCWVGQYNKKKKVAICIIHIHSNCLSFNPCLSCCCCCCGVVCPPLLLLLELYVRYFDYYLHITFFFLFFFISSFTYHFRFFFPR